MIVGTGNLLDPRMTMEMLEEYLNQKCFLIGNMAKKEILYEDML